MIATRRQQGMSLLEIMVALSIFSIIGLASYQVLSSVMAANLAVKVSADHLERMQKSYAQIERDMEQLVSRRVRFSDGLGSDALVISEQGQQIELTRGGRDNSLQFPRSRLLRVRYDLGFNPQDDSLSRADQQLYLRRLSWPVLDRSSDNDEPYIQLLVPVDALSISAISNKDRYDSWPPQELADDERLLALSLVINHVDLGELVRLIKVY